MFSLKFYMFGFFFNPSTLLSGLLGSNDDIALNTVIIDCDGNARLLKMVSQLHACYIMAECNPCSLYFAVAILLM